MADPQSRSRAGRRRANRAWLALAAAASSVALSACDVVMSSNPVLLSADASRSLVLEPGMWTPEACSPSLSSSSNCQTFEITADGVKGLMDRRPFKSMRPEDATKFTGPQPYVIGDGHPPVLQLRYPAGGAVVVKGPDRVMPEDKFTPLYVFLGIEPLARNSSGRIVELRAWPVLCGPPLKIHVAPDAAPLARRPYPGPTEHPLPGVTMIGLSCSISGREALHRAADLSQPFVDQPMRLRWIGDAPSKARAP